MVPKCIVGNKYAVSDPCVFIRCIIHTLWLIWGRKLSTPAPRVRTMNISPPTPHWSQHSSVIVHPDSKLTMPTHPLGQGQLGCPLRTIPPIHRRLPSTRSIDAPHLSQFKLSRNVKLNKLPNIFPDLCPASFIRINHVASNMNDLINASNVQHPKTLHKICIIDLHLEFRCWCTYWICRLYWCISGVLNQFNRNCHC